MGDLTKNFSRSEFTCECGCGLSTIDFLLVKRMQKACDYFARMLHLPRVTAVVLGGNRCVAHNIAVCKKYDIPVTNSTHSKCMASDWYIKEVSVLDLYHYLRTSYPDDIGLGYYPNRVHLDVRGHTARWNEPY